MRSPEEIAIRQAESGDVEGIRQCLRAAFEPYRSDYTAGAYLDTVPDEAGILQRVEHMHVLVAVAPDVIAGTVSAALGSVEGHLRGMAVRPEWRGSGLSALLLHPIENWLGSKGCKRVTLDTVLPLQAAIRFYDLQAAIRFYEKNGYRRTGTVTDLYGMPLVDYVKEIG